MNAKELQKLLASHGCTFETKKSGHGHVIVKLRDKRTELPMHGHGKELGKGLVHRILKDLGLK
jgi:mRNA interferase HicA